MVDSWYNEMQGNWENAFLITGVRYKRVLSHTFNCAWGEEYHSLHRSVGKKGLDTPRKTPKWKRQGCLLSRLLYCVCYITYSFLLIILLRSVWISDETVSLVFNILLLGDWISDESLACCVWYITYSVWISDDTLLLVFDVLRLGVWISDESLRLVFDILLIVFGNQMKHSSSCLIYYFLVFDNQMNRVWYITPRYLNIEWNNPCRVWRITCQIERFCHDGTSFKWIIKLGKYNSAFRQKT